MIRSCLQFQPGPDSPDDLLDADSRRHVRQPRPLLFQPDYHTEISQRQETEKRSEVGSVPKCRNVFTLVVGLIFIIGPYFSIRAAVANVRLQT